MKLPITASLEKALSAYRYRKQLTAEERKLARLCDAELLVIIKRLDMRIAALEAGR